MSTTAHPARPSRSRPAPALPGATAVLHGASTFTGAARRHLCALGATVEDAHAGHGEDVWAGERPGALAGHLRLELADGRRRELAVSWAGPVDEPGLVDEATVQALCGVMHVHGRRDGRPTPLTIDFCQTGSTMLGLAGLLASLRHDARSVRVETSVAEAALISVSQYLAAATADDPEPVALAPGGPPFLSADGVPFEVEALEPHIWSVFWDRLDAPSSAVRRSWRAFQFRYATATAPVAETLGETSRRHGFTAIRAAAAHSGASVCPLHRRADHLAELRGPAAEGVLPPWSLHDRADHDRGRPGDHGASLTRPLHGLRVLEAGRRIQAPLAAHLLRLLGAHVTRIEPPGGDPLRGMPPYQGALSARWLAINRGKDAVEIDIKDPADRRRLRDLAEDADVFLHNWAPATAGRLGLTAEDMPGHLVYAYTSGWGQDLLHDPPLGTDFMVQARTGLSDLVREPDRAPAPSLMTVLDVLGGLLGAEAIVAGLLRRAVTGRGAHVQSSLLHAATHLHRADVTVPATTPSSAPLLTTDLADLPADPRLAPALHRPEPGGGIALCGPWRFS